jgi:3-hydroxyisobutyrate dehydrogenase-like beta-hydroxyacid dehydrogenase
MTAANGSAKGHGVAVIGCGLMGSALARGLVTKGYSVLAWNRTTDKAQELAPDGVVPVPTVAEAVSVAPLVIACTSTYETTRQALDGGADWTGTTLVNVTTGTPDEAIEMHRWAAARGAGYLDGAILAFPADIGSPEAMIAYAGDRGTWEDHERTLMTIAGASRHISDQVQAANVLDVAAVGSFYTATVAAYVEAACYAKSQGLSADLLAEVTQRSIALIGHASQEASAAIETGAFETDQATLAVYAEAGRSFLAVMRAAGQRARMLGAAVESLADAEAAGLGGLGIYALAKVADAPAGVQV